MRNPAQNKGKTLFIFAELVFALGTVLHCPVEKPSERTKFFAEYSQLVFPQAIAQCKEVLLEKGFLPDSCRTHDSAKDHFGPREYPGQQFVYINGDAVNLRASPSTSAKILTPLQLSTRARILHIGPAVTIDSAPGHWVFVEAQPESPMIDTKPAPSVGWVFDYFISRKSDFQKLSSPPPKLFCQGLVDSFYCISFQSDSKAIRYGWSKPEFGGTSQTVEIVRRHRNLILTAPNTDDEQPLIFTQVNGILRSERYYGSAVHDEAVRNLHFSHIKP